MCFLPKIVFAKNFYIEIPIRQILLFDKACLKKSSLDKHMNKFMATLTPSAITYLI